MSTVKPLITNSPEENRRIVLEALQNREARHTAFEKTMIKTCNQHCADVKKQEQKQQDARAVAQAVTDEERRERARERLRAIQEAQRQEREAYKAVKLYALTVFILLLLPVWTAFPYWASFTTALGLGFIFAVHLYRIFVPLETEVAR